MLTTFDQLFQLEFQHEYFNYSNPASYFQLGPTILNGAPDIQLRKNENGYFAIRPKPPKLSTQGVQPPAFLSLCFPIKFLDPNFFSYTEINFSPPTVLYFSTDQATDGVIKSSDAINITLHPHHFYYPMDLTSLKNLTSVSLTHPSGDIQELPLPVAPYPNGYPVDLTGEIAGKYELAFNFKEKNENKTYVFFASDHFFNNPPPAIFDYKLNIDSSVTNKKHPTYTILFESRSTYWRYIFPDLTEEEWSTLNVDSKINNQTIVFNNTKQKFQLPNGQLAYTVLSPEPIPLMERPPWKVKLTTKRLSEGTILPYPQPTSLTRSSAQDRIIQESLEVYISDVFCYI